MTVRNIDDIHEEELDECEAKNTKLLMADHYSQEYLYVKMTARLSSQARGGLKTCDNIRSRRQSSRWPTLEELRPKLKKVMEEENTALSSIQVQVKSNKATQASHAGSQVDRQVDLHAQAKRIQSYPVEGANQKIMTAYILMFFSWFTISYSKAH